MAQRFKVYLEFLALKGQQFVIHLDFNIKDFEPVVRLSISNMYDQFKASGNALQIPFPKDAPEKWTIMVLDVPYHLANSGIFKNSMIKSFNGIHSMRSAQICSQISIRGIYTSDNIYTLQVRYGSRSLSARLPLPTYTQRCLDLSGGRPEGRRMAPAGVFLEVGSERGCASP